MSYAGKVTTSRTGARRSRAASRAAATAVPPRPVPAPSRPRRADEYELDLPRLAAFGAGLALGALLGATGALLLAPQSGEETRDDIVHGARALRERAGDAWDDLRWNAGRGRRRIRHGVDRGRWALEDLFG